MRAQPPLAAAILIAVIACGSASPPAAAPSPAQVSAGSPGPITRTEVMIGESFRPRTDEASIESFRFTVEPFDSGGECNVTRTGGNGSTIVLAAYPSLRSRRTSASIHFDSAGHVISFSETYYAVPEVPPGPLPAAKLDSALRAQRNGATTSGLTLNYPFDQAILTNRSPGKPTDAILAPIRRVEKLATLGPPIERLARMRKLCGV